MNILGIGSIVEGIGRVADDLFTSDEERLKAALEEKAIDAELVKGQLDINKTEAAHKSVFVSGARPFILWVCGIALAYASLIEPIGRFVAVVAFGFDKPFPVVDTSITMQVLLGILGLGVYRSYEKVKGVASK